VHTVFAVAMPVAALGLLVVLALKEKPLAGARTQAEHEQPEPRPPVAPSRGDRATAPSKGRLEPRPPSSLGAAEMTGALYNWILLIHILAAMVWVGGVVVLTALVARALHDPDAEAVGRFARTLRAVGPPVLAPAPVLVLGFGIWLVVESPAWDLGQLWLQLALGLLTAALLIGVAFQSRAAIGAERAVARGDHQAVVAQLRRWSWGSRTILVLLLVAAWAMVFKPGL